MRAVVLIILAACAASRAKPAPAVDPPAKASAATAKDQPAAMPIVQPGGRSCVELLRSERAVAENQQLALAHDHALLASLAQCERFLVDRGGTKLKDATGESLALYSVSPEALADLPEQEVHSYIALLNRFALVGDLRRQLYYSPRLRPWFERIAQLKPCSDPVREAALYFSATPESLGGSMTLGATIAARCP